MRDTRIIEKIFPSIINTVLLLIITLPILYLRGPDLVWKLTIIGLFYIIQIGHTHENAEFRCFGMKVFGTRWKKKYTKLQRNIYSILYTLSFATLFISFYYPFDVFIINMLALQLPAVLLTGTTLHGYFSGNMRTVTVRS